MLLYSASGVLALITWIMQRLTALAYHTLGQIK